MSKESCRERHVYYGRFDYQSRLTFSQWTRTIEVLLLPTSWEGFVMLWQGSPGRVPQIHTPLPGPNAAALIASDEQVTSPSYTRVYPLVVAQGEGCTIEDVDGNLFLDFTAGIAVNATGHCHPRIVAAIQDQAERLLHMSGTDFYNVPQRDLAQKLAAIAPGDAPKKVFFTNSGAEAVEAAFKLARYHTRRQHMIAFRGAFHGRTMGALSLTGSKIAQRRGFAPLVPGVTHIDYSLEGLHSLERIFKTTLPPDEVAGIIVEPIQGEGGYLVPPPEFHPTLRKIADEHGILLIADEVQSGMGRTGKMFAMEHWGVVPDIACLAKGIASGLPLGAIIARSDVMDWPPGSHASTFGGNPVSCAAALATIALLEEELIASAASVGEYLQAKLHALLVRRADVVREVRGRGLMIGMELKTAAQRDELVQACFHRGLLLLGCGASTIRFCPPLIVTTDECDTAVEILAAALEMA
jgi:4-aminobutyrate aminotransferase